MRYVLLVLLFAACTTPQQEDKIKLPTFDALSSACGQYVWKNRGRAPEGYVQGMAAMFAEHCKDKPRALGSSSRDALVHYGLDATTLNTWTLLMGLGMRESSGKYCEGRDLSADFTSSDGAEAGMFQSSWNSHVADPELVKITAYYKANPSKCKLTLFAQGVTCKAHNAVNYGSGPGLEYQKLAKSCPAFAVEYASVLIRVLRQHFGPLNRKEAEVVPACRAMFEKVCE